MKAILPVSAVLFLMGGIFVAQAEMKLPELKKQPIFQQHFEALLAHIETELRKIPCRDAFFLK